MTRATLCDRPTFATPSPGSLPTSANSPWSRHPLCGASGEGAVIDTVDLERVRELIAWTEALCAEAAAVEEARRLQAEARALQDTEPAAPMTPRPRHPAAGPPGRPPEQLPLHAAPPRGGPGRRG